MADLAESRKLMLSLICVAFFVHLEFFQVFVQNLCVRFSVIESADPRGKSIISDSFNFRVFFDGLVFLVKV